MEVGIQIVLKKWQLEGVSKLVVEVPNILAVASDAFEGFAAGFE